ncbi:indole-3-glycerol phosphate synthase TrpC [Caldanaerobius polysaccharolyticus]|uniref:indole-3-glycerol phosphate synthase TrpC n=1 Tax=Caldanaerobius polysaccharolyticus TaxID=44256 RepID=UPI00047A8C9A|nr:indole-3-glycerol phosphate synthase TrpC [Caldanaerobius polysaccharolyticus]
MILDEIVAYKRLEIEEEKKRFPFEKLIKAATPSPSCNARNFKRALKPRYGDAEGTSISIIAEIKKASPSKGVIRQDVDPVTLARLYQAGGADAVSVLTERKFFLGEDKFVTEVKNAISLPVLRKDFIVDKYQLYQSKVIGADAVLLIVAVLGRDVREYYELARSLGLDCLVEVHDEQEVDIAVESGADIIGINNRDLRDFTVNLKNTEKLIKKIPDDVVKVSESGIKTSDDIRYLRSMGVDGVLIGETFMRSADVISAIKELKMVR